VQPIPADGVAVVIGSSGGIGAAVMAALTADARFSQVIALSRGSAPCLDLTREGSVAAAADFAAAQGEIRLVFDATGVLSAGGAAAERSWRELDPAAMALAFQINAIGPALLMKHFLPRLPRQGKAVFATLSARVGSISDNALGGWYSYRASKAALNQLVRTAAVELARRAPEAVCLALHPGTVDTPLSRQFRKAGLEVRSPDEAATRLLTVIDDVGPAHTGLLLDYAGTTIPW
jgi:hypothetical protein